MSSRLLEWIVIGAGPAGIAAVGSLLDHRIAQDCIGWLDPCFEVGDLGSKWQNVPSNTKVGLFLKFLHARDSFEYKKNTPLFPIDCLAPNDHCLLKEVAAPLQWVTHRLASKVETIRGEALSIDLKNGVWEIQTKTSTWQARNVILATGADPKRLPFSHPDAIPLETALDPVKLKQEILPTDIVGVFGSSHSAVLVLAHLAKIAPRQIHNFYRSPHLYAVEHENWILFDNTGLKGFAASWARQYLDGALPQNLNRCLISSPEFKDTLESCTKVIYAVGFEKRPLPIIIPFPSETYQETVGIIAPGLFGLGIAYPQAKLDPFGKKEYRVGLWKFMDYLDTVMPIWLKTCKKPEGASIERAKNASPDPFEPVSEPSQAPCVSSLTNSNFLM